MGAFCVFGISRGLCRAEAARKTPVGDKHSSLSPAEWAAKRDVLAARLFEEATRRVKISPELDAPQFCTDWLAADPGQARDTVIMVRGPKRDKLGEIVRRRGVIVQTWVEYEAECKRRDIPAYAEAS